MAVLVLVGVVACGLAFLAGCSAEATFAIEVQASPNLSWSGTYWIISADGRSTEYPVEGKGDWRATARGTRAAISFRKLCAEGTLEVRIIMNGISVIDRITQSSYGQVSGGAP